MPTDPDAAQRPEPTAADRQQVVTAVVVAHDGERWLPAVLAALTEQTRPPDVLVAADTAGADGSADLLRVAAGPARLATCPAGTGFGDAVRAALDLAPPAVGAATEWVWLLHDDCVPAPEALEVLLRAAAGDPAAGVLGPKLRALEDPRLLREVGVTVSRGGRRETGLDRREHDQGQHDGTREVLAVSTAGLLVRRDVWDELGGLDPALPLLRDDLDLGWRARLAGHGVRVVTDAVAYHGEATGRGQRAPSLARRLHRLDRAHGAYVLLVNLPLTRLPGAVLTLLLGALLRAAGDLLVKRPRWAADELVALACVLGRPLHLARARARRRRTRRVPARTVLALLAPRRSAWRAVAEAAGRLRPGRVGSATSPRQGSVPRHSAAPDTGPAGEESEDLPSWGSGLVRRALLRPAVGLLVALTLLALVAARDLLGDGRLMGGALLPAPASAGELWAAYLASWHPVGLGTSTAAPPYLAVLAALAALLGGAERAVSLLLLAAVPLAGLSAYLASARLRVGRGLRLWGAVTYALLPPVLGAVAAGRLGTAVLAVLLPPAGVAVAAALDRSGGWRAVGAAALLLAGIAAFVPMTLVVVAALAVVAALVLRGAALARLGGLVAGPPVLLLPWLPALAADPGRLLRESGLPGPGLADPDWLPAHALFLHPGGPGLPPLPLTAGLVLAALAGLLRPDRRRPVLLGWLLAVVGLAMAVGTARAELSGPTVAASVPAWPGPGLLLAGGGLVLAAVVGAQGVRERVARQSFGWRQPTAALILAAALLGPLLVTAWWLVGGAGGPLERRDPVLLPAFVAAEGAQPDRPRTLVLRARPDGSIGYAVLREDGPTLGDAEVGPGPGASGGLDAVVADLASGRGGDAAARLVPYGVRFVLLAPPARTAVVRAVDAVPGVVRVSGPSGAVLWRLDYRVARARIVPADAPVSSAAGSPPPARVLAAGEVGAEVTVPAGEGRRLLVLADPVDPGWRARLDGVPLRPRTYDGWAQAFVLPPEGGRLRLGHDDDARGPLLWGQAAALLVMVVLALPGARSEEQP